MIAYAADLTVDQMLANTKTEILYPLVSLMFAVALLYFLWGVVKFIRADESSDDRKTGRRHMLWGIIGLAIMLSAIGIIIFVYNTVTNDGAEKGYKNVPIPTPSVVKNKKL